MINRVVTVDFSKKCGKIKPICAINGGPLVGGAELAYDFSEEYKEMGIPLVRVSGRRGEYGFNQLIDVHCIFPDPEADESLEESYNFAPTDRYLLAIKATGASVIYRLGESPEPYSKKLYATPPADKQKWARICEHIVMHYNEGWANGFKLGIKHWEIWSSPDSDEGFSGEACEFFELYRTVACHLRERFPKIKIGGYGSGGFYSLNRIGSSEREERYVSFAERFLAYVNSPDGRAPLDFFTWSSHATTPEELSTHVKYARSYLDTAGAKRTKSIICDFNIAQKLDTPPALCPEYPSELAAALILAQRGDADMVFYSSSEPSRECALYTVDDSVTHRRYAAYKAMCALGKLYRLGGAVETTGDYRKELYTLAATDGKERALLIVTGDWGGKLEIHLSGGDFSSCDVEKTVAGGERGEGRTLRAEGVTVARNRIILPTRKREIYLITVR